MGDSEKELQIALTKGDQAYMPPAGSMALLYTEKPDGTHGMYNGRLSGGTVVVPVDPQMVSVAGNVRCQLEIVTANQTVLYSPEFILSVARPVSVGIEVESADDYRALDDILTDIEEFWERGGIRVVQELPAPTQERPIIDNTIVYVPNTGIYRYSSGLWSRLTDDETVATVLQLQAASHNHANKELLDKFSLADNVIAFDGTALGIRRVTSLPDWVAAGTIVYYRDIGNNESANGLYIKNTTNNPRWIHLTFDNVPGKVNTMWQLMHNHENAAVLAALTQAVIDNSHRHLNGDTLAKFGETADGMLLFDGKALAGGIKVVGNVTDLDASAPDGSTALVLYDEADKPLASDGDAVQVPGKQIRFGTPEYSASGLEAALTAGDVSLTTALLVGETAYQADLLPIIDDASDNPYASAGLTVEGSAFFASSCTKDYAVIINLGEVIAELGFGVLVPDKIVQVDATHLRLPTQAIFAFESLTGATGSDYEGMKLETGWNAVLATFEAQDGEITSFDPVSITVVNGVDINEYIIVQTDGSSSIECIGSGSADIFAGLFVQTGMREKGLYVKNGMWRPADEATAVTPLGFTTYTDLVIRKDLQHVPVYIDGGVGEICRLTAYVDGDDDDYIALAEIRQSDTGMPLRYIKTQIGGVFKAYLPAAHRTAGGTVAVPAGWTSDGQPTTAPSFNGFAPNRFSVAGKTYDDLTVLPDDAQSALISLSQCINVSAAAMGHINTPDDAVVRFAGRIEPNRKYSFQTGDDCVLTLPKAPWSQKDTQFTILLTCTADVDLSLPADTLIAGGINSNAGQHKLIGCWLRDAGKWSVGGVDYEAVT